MDVTARARADSTFNDRYELSEKLGQGGMGSVHKGLQRALNRPVAIKFMAPELAQEKGYVDRFLAEAQLAASLVHGSVVAVFDFGLVAGVPYLVTEFIPGQTLNDVLRDRTTLPVGETLAIARAALDGLAAIHKLGIVHRDIKPANLLVLPGNPPGVKILDFGIAKQTTGAPLAEGAPQTATGMVMGTPEYMAPEQAAGDQLTPAADLYALSLVLYRMIVGEHPFKAKSTLELLRMQIHNDITVPDHILPRFRELLERGLAKRPADRVQSASDLRWLIDGAAPEAERTGSFVRAGASAPGVSAAAPGPTAPTPRASRPDLDVVTLPSAVVSEPPGPTVPTPVARPPETSRVWSVLGAALIALGAVAAWRTATHVPPPDAWNHDWKAPFVKVPGRAEPWPKVAFAQTHGFNYDDPTKGAAHMTNYRPLPGGQQQWDLVFDEKDRDDLMRFGNATTVDGALLITPQPHAAYMAPGYRCFVDEGAMEVQYEGVQTPGLIDVQLLSARDGVDEQGVLYRLRVDLNKPGWEAMVSEPAASHAEKAEQGNRGYRFDSELWRMIARHEDPALATKGVVRLAVKDRTLTATVNDRSHTYDLGDVYRVKTGGLYPRLFVSAGSALLIKRVTLLGPLARGFQSMM